MKTTRRGFLGALLAIPAAVRGIAGEEGLQGEPTHDPVGRDDAQRPEPAPCPQCDDTGTVEVLAVLPWPGGVSFGARYSYPSVVPCPTCRPDAYHEIMVPIAVAELMDTPTGGWIQLSDKRTGRSRTGTFRSYWS